MHITSMIICSILFLISASAMETALEIYEKNSDSKVVDVLGVGHDRDSLVLLTKKYLSKRKAFVNPSLASKIHYEITEIGMGKRIPLISIPVDEHHVIGKSVKIGRKYVIPIVRNNKFVEVYRYDLTKNKIVKDSLDIKIKNENIASVFSTSQGHVLVSPSGAGVRLFFYSNKKKIINELSLIGIDEIISVDDLNEFEDHVYITGVGSTDKNNDYVYIYELFKKNEDGKAFVSSIKMARDEFIRSKFLSKPSSAIEWIKLVSSSLSDKPAEIKIIEINKPVKILWKTNTKKADGDKYFSFIGLCEGRILAAKRSHSKNNNIQDTKFFMIDKNGNEKSLRINLNHKKDIPKEVILSSSSNYLYSVTNFSRFENSRRENGWYNWDGYNVNIFNINNQCTID